MASGKESARQKMINLMYLVFIAMLAMNMSKEVLSAFGFMNEELTSNNLSTADKNTAAYRGLAQKAQDQPAKFKTLNEKAVSIKNSSSSFYSYLESLKTKMTQDIEDKKAYESMDKTNFLDEHFFKGDGYTKEGKEFVAKINDYRVNVTNALGSGYNDIKSVVANRFNTDEIKNKDDIKVKWLDYRYKGFPLIASLTNVTQIQANIKNTENDILSSLLGGQLESDSKLTTNNYKGIVRLDKTAYFSGERVTGQVVLGRYDDQLVPSKVTLGNLDITKNVKNGQVLLDMPAGNVGEKTIKGVITFMQDGKAENIPFESSYSVIAEPSEAVISADKMNVVYRGLDNPISISVPGVGDKDINPSVGGGNILTKLSPGKFILNPGSGNEVKINVTAKLSSGKTINTPKTFRIKDIPAAAGTIRGDFGIVPMPKSSLSNTPIAAELPDFVFDLQLEVKSFTVKVPGQLAIKCVGTKLNARAKKALAKARRGDVITIFDIQAIEKTKGVKIKKVLPVSIQITN
ncbi:MAG: gliding motility protein GldM [Flavobacteriaceae bacterium]|nr:gliding motility protein GldM [Flavobacteriaceae bacterium]